MFQSPLIYDISMYYEHIINTKKMNDTVLHILQNIVLFLY